MLKDFSKLPHIPIYHREDLARYGFDWQRFQKKGRAEVGFEFHGPCPRCGGDDRLMVSNGLFVCRQCRYRGNLAKISGVKFSEADYRRVQEQAQKEEDRRRRELKRLREQLTKSRLWESFHRNLLEQPEWLRKLEQDEIPRHAVEHFQIGFIPKFEFWIDHKRHYAPALAFPHFWYDPFMCVGIRCRILADWIEGDKYRPFWPDMGAAFLLADDFGLREEYPLDYGVFVEGEKKSIVLWSNGIPSVGLWGVWTVKEKWIPFFQARYRRRYVAFDGDGQAAIMASHSFAQQVGGKELFLGGKPDDLMRDGWLSPEDIVAEVSALEET